MGQNLILNMNDHGFIVKFVTFFNLSNFAILIVALILQGMCLQPNCG